MAKIRVHDLGDDRWHMTIKFDRTDRPPINQEFKQWMQDNYPSCMCQYRFNNGTEPFWELRGGDPMDQIMIALRWS